METRTTDGSPELATTTERVFLGFLSRLRSKKRMQKKAMDLEKQARTTSEEASTVQLSDIESFLQARCETARQRNRRFMERFVSLRQFQQKAEDSLERVRRNPITLRAMSDLSANAESENVLVEVARRRADNFSHDSEDCNAALRDFETQMSAYFRLAFLTLEISMEAPLPELGRPAALQKNLWIFFKSVCDCEELKVFQSDNSGKTVHSEICKKVDEIMRVFLAAQNKLDRLYHDLEQPMNIEPLFTNSGCETNYLNNQEKIA